MTSRRKKLARIATIVLAALIVLVGVSLIVVQTKWFSDFVLERIIATLEDSTGAKVEIGSFRFEPLHLTARIRDLVLHGTEAKTEEPLVRISVLELRLKLFAGLRKAIDLAYLGIEQPRVNLIVNPDGSTNIPEPKVKRATSTESPLATVVDLAVGEFRVDNGVVTYSQRKTPMSLRGDNLRVLLNYSALSSRYQGVIRIDPLKLTSGSSQPLLLRVNVPLEIRRDGLSVAGAQLDSEISHILLTASLNNLNAPKIAAAVNARVSLLELKQAFDLPITTNAPTTPAFATADLDTKIDQESGNIGVQHLRLALGNTFLNAAGTANRATGDKIQFSGNVALGELSRLFKISSPRIAGDLVLNGDASLDGQKNYSINGTINSRGLALADGASRLSNVSLSTPFQITPDLIKLNSLRLHLLEGELSANILIEEMRRLNVDGQLHSISLSAVSSALAGRPINYGALISGTLTIKSDLKEQRTSGLNAYTRLSMVPGRTGVPVKGLIEASYAGKRELIEVKNAYISLPASRMNVSGSLNKSLNVTLESRNLNDFLPAVRYSGSGSTASLPIALKGGEAKLEGHIQGDLSSPRIIAHAALTRFAAQNHMFDALSFDVAASPNSAAIQNGALRRGAMQAAFDGSIGLVKWSPVGRSKVSSNLTLRNADLGDLLALGGMKDADSNGNVEADLHIDGTYGDPLGSVSVQVSQGMALGQPFDRVGIRATLADQLVTLSGLDVDAAGGKVTVNGTFHHPADRFNTGHTEIHLRSSGVRLSKVARLQQQSAGVAGVVDLTADAAAELTEKNGEGELQVSSINADFSANNLRIRNQDAGSLAASARTTSGAVSYTVKSNFAGSSINVGGQTSLAADYATKARASIRNLSVQKALELAGQGDIPADGLLTADADISGNSRSPDATIQLELTKASVYQEPINRLTAKVQYRNDLLDLPLLELVGPAGNINLTGRYDHPNGGNSGSLKVHLNRSELDVAKFKRMQRVEPGIAGKLRVEGDLTANVSERSGQQHVQVSSLNADLNATTVRVANRNLGDVSFSARTKQSSVTFRLDSDLAQSEIHVSGTSQLVPDYPTRAEATFKNVRYQNLAPLLGQDQDVLLPFDALMEGRASVTGPVLDANSLAVQLEVSRLELSGKPRSGSSVKVVQIQNDQPIVIGLNKQVLTLQRFAMRGPQTSMNATGSIDLADARNTLHLNMTGNLNLGILQEMDRDFYSSGDIALNASVAGSLNQPILNGSLALKNANINYADAPNGLSNANGVILLSGNTASVRNLTGESGGGKIELSGSVSLSPSGALYNLRAKATSVRSRYSGASITSSANIALTGSSRHSVLAGTVTVQRVAYSSSSDIGSLLYNASTPPATPSEPSPLLAGIRLDVHITTASDLRVATAYVDKLELSSNLNLRGTVVEPGILGRINVTDGQLVFFGNTYTVNAGSINFYDASSIRPELNLSLETIAQGVDVELGVAGPMSNMKLSYRSDPPLSFEQIVQLLATNTTPFDPTIAAHQPAAPQQSLSQMGESQVLGEAVANPVASRVQRVFGLTQFKIDPSIAGNNGQPTAKITLRQKVTNNLTFTYITDVTQTNSEIVRVELDLNSKASVVALRDYNGNVSLQLFYKFQVR